MARITEDTLEAINTAPQMLNILQNEFGKDKTGRGFICPSCGNGNGATGDGVTRKQGHKGFNCFACGTARTPLNWLKEYSPRYKGMDWQGVYSDMAEQTGVIIQYEQEPPTKRNPAYKQEAPEPQTIPDDSKQAHFEEYYARCCINRDLAFNYLGTRGISRETIENNKFYIGYDERKKSVVIAASISCYILRATGEYIAGETGRKKRLGTGAKADTWNFKALENTPKDKPIFVVEGAIDALSIIEVGGHAIALQSTAFINKFMSHIDDKNRPQNTFILALDNDKAGKKANEELADRLNEKGLNCFIYSYLSGQYKDPNERLIHDREGLEKEVNRTAEEWTKLALYNQSNAGFLDDILGGYKEPKSKYPTGFSNLDKHLDGGLYAGVYFIGAISSLGKTTFILQMADSIAKAGNHVLYFSLEMSRSELIAKSLSRLTAGGEKLTTRQILSKYHELRDTQRAAIENAVEEYRDIAGNLFVYAKVGDIGIDDIESHVRIHIEKTNTAPIVFIDYLQIMKPLPNVELKTEKQQTDEAVKRLKLLAEKYNIPIVAISSFNRANYTDPVNMASYKESGAIEYSSDCLIGLQPEYMNYKKGDNGKWETDSERKKRLYESQKLANAAIKQGKPLLVECKILKNRNGIKGNCYFDMYPGQNRYEPIHFSTDAEMDSLLEKRAIQARQESPEVQAANDVFDSNWTKGGKAAKPTPQDLNKKTVKDKQGKSWTGRRKGNYIIMESANGEIMKAAEWIKQNYNE